jgi:hypothetical protein
MVCELARDSLASGKVGDFDAFLPFSGGEALRAHDGVTICKSSGTSLENPMTHDLPVSKKTLCGFMGVVAILFYIWLLTWSAPVHAAPGIVAPPQGQASQVQQAKIFQRGRTPQYPYATGVGPRGRQYYFGFVPYEKGNIEIQALQRMYPEANYPPGMRYWTPESNY